MGQQQTSVEVPRPKLASAKPLPTPAAPTPSRDQLQHSWRALDRWGYDTKPCLVCLSAHDLPPSAPNSHASGATRSPASGACTVAPGWDGAVWAPGRVSSPWVDLMDARAALGAGDTYETRARLAAAQSALLSQPSRRHYFAATQISMAVALINAGATLPALHFLDLAIANAGGGVPYAAENVQPPQPIATCRPGRITQASECPKFVTRVTPFIRPLFFIFSGLLIPSVRGRMRRTSGAGHSLESDISAARAALP